MLQRPRGTADRLPEAAPAWRLITGSFERECRLRGYRPISTPTFEATELFSRGSGESTDIVQREMYTFQDRGGDSLTLRPECTPPVVRAYLQNGMQAWPQPVKLAYVTSIFRYDRPQAGRYREHHQLGVEALGDGGALLDAEVIDLLWSTLRSLGLNDLKVELNSLGDPDTRPAYRQALVDYFTPLSGELCADCRTRLAVNPLRLLDCKKAPCNTAGGNAPRSIDFIGDPAREHFTTVQELLRVLGVDYAINHRLVRGLDYYNRTVFEITPPDAGAQGTVGGGGRYDYLAEALGGPHLPGVGFGSGVERILLNMQRVSARVDEDAGPAVFVAPLVCEGLRAGVEIAAELRASGLSVEVAAAPASARAQLRRANARGAHLVVILGARELAANSVTLKSMAAGEQAAVARDAIVPRARAMLGEPS